LELTSAAKRSISAMLMGLSSCMARREVSAATTRI
jgi:hypothetical protein